MNICSLNWQDYTNVFIVNKLANTVNTKFTIVVLGINCNECMYLCLRLDSFVPEHTTHFIQLSHI